MIAPVATVQVGSTWVSTGAAGVGGTAPIVTLELVELHPAAFCAETVCVLPAIRPV